MEGVSLCEGAPPSFFRNSPTGCSFVSLPFGVKVWGQEEMCLIPQLHGRLETPVSFMLFCCERRLNATLLPNYISHQEACQSVEGGRTHRAVSPSLAHIRSEGQGLQGGWKVGKQKNWLRREREIRGKTE